MANETHGDIPPVEGIGASQAVDIARRTVKALNPDRNYELEQSRTIERAYGWVFFYAPAKYLETRDRNYMTPGNGPLVVYRSTGKTEFLSSSLPPEKALEILEQRLQKK